MHVRSCGINCWHNKNFKIEKPHGFGDFLFLHLKTPTRFYIDGQVQDAAEGDIILYDKGAPQYYEELEVIPHVDDYMFFDIDNEKDREFVEQLPLKFNRILHLPYINPFMNIHQSICMEFVSRNTLYRESIDCLLRYFLIKLSEGMAAGDSGSDYATFARFHALRLVLYSSPVQKWTVREMADYVNLSPSYFQNVYRKLFRTSCMEDLFNSRMNYAKELLTTSHLPVNEIAERCGYDSNIYFSRHFKNKVGITPSEYRKRHTLF